MELGWWKENNTILFVSNNSNFNSNCSTISFFLNSHFLKVFNFFQLLLIPITRKIIKFQLFNFLYQKSNFGLFTIFLPKIKYQIIFNYKSNFFSIIFGYYFQFY